MALHQSKAEFFRRRGHPVREMEASSLSQQLAVLRRAGLVYKSPDGRCGLAGPDVADLTGAARSFLTRILTSRTSSSTPLLTRPAWRCTHECRRGGQAGLGPRARAAAVDCTTPGCCAPRRHGSWSATWRGSPVAR
ncbi:hypothetical protein [Micromonospora tulbaghiae]|uniref:hypothetical protein n=1 Tax=Micromonospora tulbaghiae TaxID=479978 RepID=UPI003EB9CE11